MDFACSCQLTSYIFQYLTGYGRELPPKSSDSTEQIMCDVRTVGLPLNFGLQPVPFRGFYLVLLHRHSHRLLYMKALLRHSARLFPVKISQEFGRNMTLENYLFNLFFALKFPLKYLYCKKSSLPATVLVNMYLIQ